MQRLTQNFRHAHAVAPHQIRIDLGRPCVNLEAVALLFAGLAEHFIAFNPPLFVRLIPIERLGPKLRRNRRKPPQVDCPHCDRPEPPPAGRVVEVASRPRIDRAGEHTLPGALDYLPPVWRSIAVHALRQPHLDRRYFRAVHSVQLRQLHNQPALQF